MAHCDPPSSPFHMSKKFVWNRPIVFIHIQTASFGRFISYENGSEYAQIPNVDKDMGDRHDAYLRPGELSEYVGQKRECKDSNDKKALANELERRHSEIDFESPYVFDRGEIEQWFQEIFSRKKKGMSLFIGNSLAEHVQNLQKSKCSLSLREGRWQYYQQPDPYLSTHCLDCVHRSALNSVISICIVT